MPPIIASLYVPNDPYRFWIALVFFIVQFFIISFIFYRHADAVKQMSEKPSNFYNWPVSDPYESKTLVAIFVTMLLPSTTLSLFSMIANF